MHAPIRIYNYITLIATMINIACNAAMGIEGYDDDDESIMCLVLFQDKITLQITYVPVGMGVQLGSNLVFEYKDIVKVQKPRLALYVKLFFPNGVSLVFQTFHKQRLVDMIVANRNEAYQLQGEVAPPLNIV